MTVCAVAIACSGGTTRSPSAASTSTTAGADTTTPSPTTGGAPPATDPCTLADQVDVEAVLGPVAGPPVAKSAMSGDGRGLVLNCVFTSADQARSIDFTQRLNSGRTAFDQNRDQATTAVVVIGPDAYWMPAGPRLLTLDGEDLVAISFRNVPVDQARAQAMMDRALRLRHGSPPATTTSTS